MVIKTSHSTSRLQRELGNKLFGVLVRSDNIEAVRKFATMLVNKNLPTEMIIGGRTYEILSFEKCRKRFDSIGYHNSVSQRTRKWKAHLGQEECEHFLKHQAEIPSEFRGNIFIFTAWRRARASDDVACVEWNGKSWIFSWTWEGDWDYRYRVLRRR